MPCTRPYWSTTASGSPAGPIFAVPAVWKAVPMCRRAQASSSASLSRVFRSISPNLLTYGRNAFDRRRPAATRRASRIRSRSRAVVR